MNKPKTIFGIIAVILIAFIVTSLSGFNWGSLGLINNYYAECPMTGATTCEASKESTGEHLLYTVTKGSNRALEPDSYNKCEVEYVWTLPAGRYGDATGSGRFTIEGTVSEYQGVLGCINNPGSQTLRIYENNQPYQFTFSHLGLNLDWTAKASFYNVAEEPEPDCYYDPDCDPGFVCQNNECVEDTSEDSGDTDTISQTQNVDWLLIIGIILFIVAIIFLVVVLK